MRIRFLRDGGLRGTQGSSHQLKDGHYKGIAFMQEAIQVLSDHYSKTVIIIY